MIFCASSVLPLATSAAISLLVWSVKLTPTFLSAETPATGSLSALPSWIADALASWPSATDMSVMIRVAWSKILLPLPASLRMLVNVRSMFAPD